MRVKITIQGGFSVSRLMDKPQFIYLLGIAEEFNRQLPTGSTSTLMTVEEDGETRSKREHYQRAGIVG